MDKYLGIGRGPDYGEIKVERWGGGSDVSSVIIKGTLIYEEEKIRTE